MLTHNIYEAIPQLDTASERRHCISTDTLTRGRAISQILQIFSRASAFTIESITDNEITLSSWSPSFFAEAPLVDDGIAPLETPSFFYIHTYSYVPGTNTAEAELVSAFAAFKAEVCALLVKNRGLRRLKTVDDVLFVERLVSSV